MDSTMWAQHGMGRYTSITSRLDALCFGEQLLWVELRNKAKGKTVETLFTVFGDSYLQFTRLRLMRDTHPLTHASWCIFNSISCFWSIDLLGILCWMGCLSLGVTRTDVDLIIKMSADGWMPLTIKTDNVRSHHLVPIAPQGQSTSPLAPLAFSLFFSSIYYALTHSVRMLK